MLRKVTLKIVAIQFCLMVGITATSLAQISAQDTDISIDPIIQTFPVTALGSDSATVVFTITNHHATDVRTITSASALSGLHSDQFVLQNDSCLGTTLSANGGTCTVSVKYHPTIVGSKSALLSIFSSDLETPILSAFVTTDESLSNQAVRRLPAVLSSVSIPETLTSGQQYTLTWSLLGYDNEYQSNLVVFNCDGITNGTCGDSYSSKFVESGNILPDSSQVGEWSYNGIASRKYNYSYTFTAPTVSLPTDYVIRFFSKSGGDFDAGKGSLSLLIPGNLSGRYYDSAGRRIVKQVVPAVP